MPRNAGQRTPHRSGAAARTRQAIDSGLTADKVPGFDPAAAPLGTDAESAGAPAPAPAPPPAPHAGPPPGQSADPAGTDRAAYRVQDRLVWPAIVAAFALAAATAIAARFLA
jgi:hypothetical protein